MEENITDPTPPPPKAQKGNSKVKNRSSLVFDLLLLLVLLAGLYFRLTGLYWGESQYLHPDERFLVWVGSDISPVKIEDGANGPVKKWISLKEYFDTANSSLNPNNRGHGFYVYGTLPMFMARFAVEWIFGHSGFDEMTQAGRALSALADILTVLLVYLVAARNYDRRVGVLAAAFSAAVVLQIQQSHFFTMDTFLNLFTFLAFYFAIRITTEQQEWPANVSIKKFLRHPLLLPSLGFGLAFGMAMASKVNAAPMALALPAAVLIRLLSLPREERVQRAAEAMLYLVLAGLVSFLVFRLAQPYAFSGPGFFGLKLNPQWLDNLRSLRAQASGDVDFPPAMQWARRPIWFSGQNLTLWGLGLPLGLLAWSGFVWAGWRMFKGEWQRHALLWGWTAIYFTWQSLALNPTMRYQLLIYPTLVIFAAWAVVALYDKGKAKVASVPFGKAPCGRVLPFNLQQAVAVLIGGITLLAAFAYALAFTQIYNRPVTRVAASRWIYQNVPGPINLRIQTPGGELNQPLSFPYDGTVVPEVPYTVNFTPSEDGILTEIFLPHVKNLQLPGQDSTLMASVLSSDGHSISSATLTGNFTSAKDSRGDGHTLSLYPPVVLKKDENHSLKLEVQGTPSRFFFNNLTTLHYQNDSGEIIEYPLFPTADTQWASLSERTRFTAPADGTISEIYLPYLYDRRATDGPINLILSASIPNNEPGISSITLPGQFIPDDRRGPGYAFSLPEPISLAKGEVVDLSLSILEKQTAIALAGDTVANEGDWDDGLPLRLDGYDAWGGIYPQDINFNMYWDDNPEKLERFLRILDQSDYIVISSNRQWGSLPRIPERFPMTSKYYRNLLGCPEDKDIVLCYREAQPGMFQGNLGYDLVKVFQSDPQIGPLRINDQFAEEAFTVYDHPKVLVFKKSSDYDLQNARQILSNVDFSKIIRLPPLKYSSRPADLMFPSDQWAEQQQGGTWSQLFDTEALQNRFQALGVLVWYLSLGLLGLLAYPIVRLALPGLPDSGYPLARAAGLLILSYLVWVAGSFRIPFTRATISAALALLLLVAASLAYYQRHALRQEWRERKRYFLTIEGLFLVFFLLDLAIRWGNPDLWHPWMGGEKPMDFSYFNAILKSTSFPPYNPWFAGGYLNYYYYGFVLVGVLVKWLGIVPSIAYNLILPTIFSLIAMGAFSLAWNIYQGAINSRQAKLEGQNIEYKEPQTNSLRYSNAKFSLKPVWVGLAGALGMALLGNLGTVRMILLGFQKLAAPGGVIEDANLLARVVWTVEGFFRNISGKPLPYGINDWYWLPSRAIPAPGDVEPITEFPFFSVLYADPHAHLYALTITLLALAFALSIILARGRWKGILGAAVGFLFGGLAIGALRPTNTWDFYPYLALGVVATGYSLWRYSDIPLRVKSALNSATQTPIFSKLPETFWRILVTSGGVLLLAGLSFILFQPWAQWYGMGYSKIDLWKGGHTPLSSYFTHWGIFLFIIVTWMAWETRDWMASTPLSSLHKLKPYKNLIGGALVALVLATILIGVKLPSTSSLPIGSGVWVAWVALPLAAWAGALLIRPGQPDAKRFVLFLVGTGLVLTLMVELIVLRGDIGRMNTVFKFYLQVWTFFAISAAAAFGWLVSSLHEWRPGWRAAWATAVSLLVAGALLYPIIASRAKVMDRMTPTAPRTLDGMAYMQYSQYDWEGLMDLSQDYRAIRWLQENVVGSPVIVEANLRDLYRWGSRYSIYTGLPDVVGWEWHQQQQRALMPGSWISERIEEIAKFYETTDPEEARAFLNKYGVKYIIMGQLERNHYPGPGLDKFEALDGVLWRAVFQDGETAIYEVIAGQGAEM